MEETNTTTDRATNTGRMPKRIFQVSQEARDHLYRLARRHGYAHNKGNSQRGISDLIAALTNPDIIWKDERPDYMKEIDSDRVSVYGKLPIWYDAEFARWGWSIRISDTHFNALHALALKWGITNFRHKRANVLERGPSVSALLEAIGQQYLVPNFIPPAPPKKHAYRPKKYEWDWLSASSYYPGSDE